MSWKVSASVQDVLSLIFLVPSSTQLRNREPKRYGVFLGFDVQGCLKLIRSIPSFRQAFSNRILLPEGLQPRDTT